MEPATVGGGHLGKAVYTIRKLPTPEKFLKVQFELAVRPKSKCFGVRLSAEHPLEGAWISSDVPLQFMTSASATYEMTRTVVDFEKKLGNKFSCTLRMKPNTKSAEFSFRPVEGFAGALELFVAAVNSTGRCAQRESFRIAPLSSYILTDAIDEQRTFNTVQISGPFSVLKAKAWLQILFQDFDQASVLHKNPDWTFCLESMILGCQMQCRIKDQEMVFRCENPSTVQVLMQVLTRQATQERTKIDIRPTILPETLMSTLSRIDTALSPVIGRGKLKSITEAVGDITAAEGSLDCLHPVFQSPGWKKMHGADNDSDPNARVGTAFLQALIIDLFKDYTKLRGKSIAPRLADLISIVQHDYSVKNLQTFAEDI